MAKITNIKSILEIMKTAKSMDCYEYYDGLQITLDSIEFLIPDEDGELLLNFQEVIFELLPHTTLVNFSYLSRFASETTYENFIGCPKSMERIELDHFQGINAGLNKEVLDKIFFRCGECQKEVSFGTKCGCGYGYNEDAEVVDDEVFVIVA